MARELGLKVKEGVLVRDVVQGGRAAEAGIRAGRRDRRDRPSARSHGRGPQGAGGQAGKNEPMVLLVNRDGQALYLAVPAA